MTTITETYPMPATNCPSFCSVDHVAHWADLAQTIGKTFTMPKVDGELVHYVWTLDNSLERFGSGHSATLCDIAVSENESLTLDLTDYGQGMELYIDATAPITAEQARAFAAELLAGAERLEAELQRAALVDQAVREIVAAEAPTDIAES